ncbi:MAG TPA: acetyl ornithine aminotransferase family protein [Thermodesulfobacteriota bacterium]|nr:acetyl ornithine aminotransferase family protein [Thermodesulfobacteriota bacterium]
MTDTGNTSNGSGCSVPAGGGQAAAAAPAAGVGPRSAALIAEDARYLSPSYTRPYPLAVARGEGMYVYDLDGRRYLDFTAGIAVTATGHCHPAVVAAIERQARTLIHMSGSDFCYAPQVELARRLAEVAPGPWPKRVFFANSGAEAVEAAIKLARYATGRPRFLAFHGAFHGRTFGALSLSASKAVHTRRFAPLLPQVHHVPYASCYRCAYGLTYPGCQLECVDVIERVHFRTLVPPDEVAAIVVEPIQGEGGYVVPPPEFLQRLRALCDRYGILLVADEVQTGMGRTGRLFACEHAGVAPDILVLAKGLASGLPLGAMIARADLMTWEPGAHASTFGGNPVACAAALATLDLLEQGLVRNAAEVGAYLLQRLRVFTSTSRFVGDVRGVGLMVGMELVRNRTTREPAVAERDRVIRRAFERGLLLLGCGVSAIRFCPPLIATREHVDEAVGILAACLEELTAQANGRGRTRVPAGEPTAAGSAPPRG